MLTAHGPHQLERPIQRARDVTSSIAKRLRSFGPYVLIELVLPGGTLLALSLYLYQRRRSMLLKSGSARGLAPPQVAVAQIAAGLLIVVLLAWGRLSCTKQNSGEHFVARGFLETHRQALGCVAQSSSPAAVS